MKLFGITNVVEVRAWLILLQLPHFYDTISNKPVVVSRDMGQL